MKLGILIIVLWILAYMLIGVYSTLIILGIVLFYLDRQVSNEDLDHHIHVPLDKVPAQYYKAYSRYLSSYEWKALRKFVLKRDRYRCVDCGVKAYHKDFYKEGEKLQVHHIHYDGIETMTFTADQCVSVCISCHKARHFR